MSRDPTRRFSDRASSYDRGRPTYPPALFELLTSEIGFSPEQVVADVGAGTGILTRALLQHGNTVYAVEPNDAMRKEAERSLAHFGAFTSLPGKAEATGLEKESVDTVFAAQAAHWFDIAAARLEFARVLRPGGYAVFIWNQRIPAGSKLLQEYEALMERWGTDYREVRARWDTSPAAERMFGSGYRRFNIDNHQTLDRAGLQARVESSSYMPGQGHPGHQPMTRDLDALFGRHQSDGAIRLHYETQIYLGVIS